MLARHSFAAGIYLLGLLARLLFATGVGATGRSPLHCTIAALESLLP